MLCSTCRYLSTITIFVLFSNITLAFSESKLNLIADQISISKDNREIIATGNVTIISDDKRLFAEKIVYDRNSKKVSVFGPLEIIDGENLRITAQSSVVSTDLKTSISKGVKALFEENFQISSDEIRQDSDGTTKFKNTMGTSCKVCDNDNSAPIWNIKSKSITHDQEFKSLVFEKAWLEIGGIPVFYTPYLKTPEPGVARATGFLTPSIISSNLLGFGIKQPFFFVLTPNSDVTISILKTNETNLIESELRALFPDESVNIKVAIEPILSKEKIKGFIQSKWNKNITNTVNLNYDVTFLTDRNFLMKYGYDETDLISNRVSFTRISDFKNDKLEAYYFQSLRTPVEKEPMVFPYFSHKKIGVFANGKMNFSKEISFLGLIEAEKKFIRLNHSIILNSRKIFPQGFHFKSSAELSSSIYSIWSKDNTRTQNLNLYPVLSSDISFPMIRKRTNRTEIINPKLQIVFSPNQEVPTKNNEDSIQVDFDRTNLFSTNRFPGKDLQESGLWLNAGLQYINHMESGKSFGAEVGQILRLANNDQFSSISELTGKRSDLLISSYFEFDDFVRLNNSLLMTNKLKLRKSDTNLKYKNLKSMVSASLLYSDLVESNLNEGKITELAIFASTYIEDNWQSIFDIRHDIATNQTISTALGLKFENECVDFSLNLSKRFGSSDNLPEDTRFEISFDLGGFGKRK